MAARPEIPAKEEVVTFKENDVINGKYTVIKKLGEGTFGIVYKVKNNEEEYSALKLFKVNNVMMNNRVKEIIILEKLKKEDPDAEHFFVKMKESFLVGNQMCVVMDILGPSLFEMMVYEQPRFSMKEIRHMLYQLCCSVGFLHKNKIIHGDIKPENILFEEPNARVQFVATVQKYIKVVDTYNIRLIDFGCSMFEDEPRPLSAGTRPFLSIEMILELDWSLPTDVWSIGCLAFELYTGRQLFNTCTPIEHILSIESTLGTIPRDLWERSKTAFFNRRGHILAKELFIQGGTFYQTYKPLNDYMKENTDDDRLFFDLLRKLLICNPSQRITLQEAVHHPFFDDLPESIRRD